jgi:hypothetical protein
MTEPNELHRNDHGANSGAVKTLENEEIDRECAEFQAQMPERIGAGEDLQSYSHMLTCERCRSLVRDLEYIAEAARELMPIEEEPREDLWNKIRIAIESGEA